MTVSLVNDIGLNPSELASVGFVSMSPQVVYFGTTHFASASFQSGP